MAKPGKKKKVLFVLEIIVLLLFIGGLYVYGQISSRLDKIEQPELKKEKIVVNQEAPKMTGYKTYVLFGIDTRGEGSQYSAQNSDTMIIVSVNNDTKEVRMVSVYRDTLLNVGDDTYTKANAAYALGGPEQAITMLNTNLDLDISDYATADFSALVEVVDDLGGLDIPLSYAEIEHMNNYCVETSKLTGKDYTPIEKPEPKPEDEEAIVGTYHLNGVQATSYCRIRYTASLDMGRTERQRRVLGMLFDKAKIAGLSSIFKIMDDVFPMVTTSLSKQDILGLIPTLIGYKFTDSTGFPQKFKFSNIKGSIIVPTDLENNVVELHKFLYDDQDYTPSSEVVARSNKILEIVGGESKLMMQPRLRHRTLIPQMQMTLLYGPAIIPPAVRITAAIMIMTMIMITVVMMAVMIMAAEIMAAVAIMITVVMTAVMIMAAMTPAVTLVVEITTAAMTPVEMRPAATMDSAMIQQQIPEQVLKNSNRELL